MPTIEIRVNRGDDRAIARILGALRNKETLLDSIGLLMVAESMQAFEQQSFGGEDWPERYPNQSSPFINVAGAVRDFASGRSEPKDRRFDRRPALRDTSRLMSSIAHQVQGGDTVEVGTTVPYASVHQFGGTSSQPVTQATKTRIASWLKTAKGKPFRGKLGPVFHVEQWETDVVRRPFLGITPALEKDIPEMVAEHIREEAGGNGDS